MLHKVKAKGLAGLLEYPIPMIYMGLHLDVSKVYSIVVISKQLFSSTWTNMARCCNRAEFVDTAASLLAKL